MPDFTGGQFPSLDGQPEAEIAQRTEPDTDGSWFRKVFTVHNRAHTKGLGPDHQFHHANFVAVLQSALQQGLHPKGVPELESETDHPTDPVRHTNLTYRVQVVPAVSDSHPETTVTPSTLPIVMADPNALQPVPSESAPSTHARWTRGEGGVDEQGAPLLPPQQETVTENPESATPQTPETEV